MVAVKKPSDLESRANTNVVVTIKKPSDLESRANTNDVVTVKKPSDLEGRPLPDIPPRKSSDLAIKKPSDQAIKKPSDQAIKKPSDKVTVKKQPDLPARKSADIAVKKSNEPVIRKSHDQLPLVKICKTDEPVQKVNENQIQLTRSLSRSDFSKGLDIKLRNSVRFPSLETPEKDIEPVVEKKKTPTVSLEDVVNVHIISPARSSPVSLGLLPTLSTYSTKLCHRCVQSIPEGVPSILFHNRTYHSKCYYCSHCRVSLFEHRAFHHQNDLYCADCHFVINIEFTPPKK